MNEDVITFEVTLTRKPNGEPNFTLKAIGDPTEAWMQDNEDGFGEVLEKLFELCQGFYTKCAQDPPLGVSIRPGILTPTLLASLFRGRLQYRWPDEKFDVVAGAMRATYY